MRKQRIKGMISWIFVLAVLGTVVFFRDSAIALRGVLVSDSVYKYSFESVHKKESENGDFLPGVCRKRKRTGCGYFC